MTDHDTMPDYDLDDDWEADEEPLPKRPRRRLVTPISATLAGALVGALGFIGGVEVQKSQDNGSSGGNLVRVKTSRHSKINRTASTTAGAIHPGDPVIVKGNKSSSGTITARQINATAAGATSRLAGLFGGGSFGGGGSGQGTGPQQAAPDGG
jgi:hypothetical protein